MLLLQGVKSWPMPLAMESHAKKVQVTPRIKSCIPRSSKLVENINVLKIGSRISFGSRDLSGFVGRWIF